MLFHLLCPLISPKKTIYFGSAKHKASVYRVEFQFSPMQMPPFFDLNYKSNFSFSIFSLF